MAFVCIRMITVTFSLAIILAACIVSFEIDLWSWGVDKHPFLTNFFADAEAMPTENASQLAVLMGDVGLLKDRKERYGQDFRKKQNKKQTVLTQLDVLTEARDGTSGGPSNPRKDRLEENAPDSNPNEKNKLSEESRYEKPPLQTEFDSHPMAKEKSLFLKPETKKAENAKRRKSASTTSRQSLQPNLKLQGNSSKRRTRAKTFLIVFMGHSGSTAFATELRTHSDLLVEVLEPLDHGDLEFDTGKALVRARDLMDSGIMQGRIPGFKIRPFHVSNKPELWQEFVKDYDTRIIWQYRENVMKQAIGEYRNRFLNDSSVVEGLMTNVEPCEQGSGQICTFKIENFRGLHALMNEFSTSDELLTQAVRAFERDKEMHIVRYEDYLYNRDRTMRDTFDFLGVDYRNTESQRRKASPDSLCEMVTNFQELCDHFIQCQLWRNYLTDDKNDCHCEPGKWKPFDSSFCQRDAWHQKDKR